MGRAFFTSTLVKWAGENVSRMTLVWFLAQRQLVQIGLYSIEPKARFPFFFCCLFVCLFVLFCLLFNAVLL